MCCLHSMILNRYLLNRLNNFNVTVIPLYVSILSPDEVAAYRAVIKNAAETYNTEKRSLKDRDTYGKAFLQIMNLWAVDDAVKKFTLAKRFAKIAADLLGVENVRIYHDQALFKEPGGGPNSVAPGPILLAGRYQQYSNHVDAFGRHRPGNGYVNLCGRFA